MQHFKAKIAHVLDNGDKIEMEAWVEAASHDEAFALAQARFKQVVGELAAMDEIEIDKSKIEMGAHRH
ncbi:hypothetical protein JFQ87_001572 [Aeromonas veronii]|nr:hypothetical protein [Aeromonas veronii]